MSFKWVPVRWHQILKCQMLVVMVADKENKQHIFSRKNEHTKTLIVDQGTV